MNVVQNYKKLIEKIIMSCILKNLDDTLNKFEEFNINNYIYILSNFRFYFRYLLSFFNNIIHTIKFFQVLSAFYQR